MNSPSKKAGTRRRLRLDRRLLIGFVLGFTTLLGGRMFVNETRWADYLIRPLSEADTAGTADVIVVPGAGVTELCSLNLSGLRRTMLAVRLYTEGRAPNILIAGGRSGAPCAVSTVMAAFAVQLGVPPDRVLTETQSTSTWENALFSDPILRKLGARRILIATDRLHLRRTEECFELLGYGVERAGIPVPETMSDNTDMLRGAFREYAVLTYYRWVIFRRARKTPQ